MTFLDPSRSSGLLLLLLHLQAKQIELGFIYYLLLLSTRECRYRITRAFDRLFATSTARTSRPRRRKHCNRYFLMGTIDLEKERGARGDGMTLDCAGGTSSTLGSRRTKGTGRPGMPATSCNCLLAMAPSPSKYRNGWSLLSRSSGGGGGGLAVWGRERRGERPTP